FATISSGLYRFLAIAVLLDVKDIPQVGPLQWGRITRTSKGDAGSSLACRRLNRLRLLRSRTMTAAGMHDTAHPPPKHRDTQDPTNRTESCRCLSNHAPVPT